MKSEPTKRLLPLLDVMMLLFGFLLIVLMAANAQRGQSSSTASAAARNDAASQQVLSSVLAGRPLAVFRVDADRASSLQLQDPESDALLPMGSADALDPDIARHLPEDGLAVVVAPPGMKGRYFDERRQAAVIEALGGDRCVILVARDGAP